MTKEEALKLALEALGNTWTEPKSEQYKIEKEAITAIKEALTQSEQCQCPNCKVTLHASDCAVHSGPAYPAGGCDCGAQPEQETVAKKHEPTIDLGKYAGTYGGYIKE